MDELSKLSDIELKNKLTQLKEDLGDVENERSFIMEALARRHKEEWPTVKRALERSFHDYQNYGYCLSLSEWHKEVNSVAVPMVHPMHGLLVFNCGAPSYLVNQEKLENEIGPRLIYMVQNIQEALNAI